MLGEAGDADRGTQKYFIVTGCERNQKSALHSFDQSFDFAFLARGFDQACKFIGTEAAGDIRGGSIILAAFIEGVALFAVVVTLLITLT